MDKVSPLIYTIVFSIILYFGYGAIISNMYLLQL